LKRGGETLLNYFPFSKRKDLIRARTTMGTMGGKACFISRVFYSLKHFSKFENFVCFSVLSYAQNIDLLENKIDGVHRGVQNIG